MGVRGSSIGVSCGSSSGCTDEFGCVEGVCPDFTIRRHDTKPDFRVSVEDCDGPMDLTDLVLEVNMWAKAKLKAAITDTDTYFALADGIGFQQIMVGDIIVMDRVRLPERMLVTGFDETNKLVQVTRGYQGTTEGAYKKGTSLRIIRIIDSSAQTEMVLDDVIQTDGTTAKDQLVESFFIYSFGPNDTCLPGCYWLEFKLMKMEDVVVSGSSVSIMATSDASIIPTFTDPSLTPTDFGCKLGDGVEWMRRYPTVGEGFLIQIVDSPTVEL